MKIPDIFKSKRFWSALVGLLFMVFTAFVPEMEAQVDVIVPAVLIIVGMLIGGYSAEDVASRVKGLPSKYTVEK